MDKEPLEGIELEMAVLVRRITSLASNKIEGNLDRAAYILLHQLHNNGTAGVKTLAIRLHLDISTVSRQAAALEKKGLAAKVSNPDDRRAYFYEITDCGKTELMKYKQARVDKFGALLSDWSEEERQQFGRLLKKFNHTIDEKL